MESVNATSLVQFVTATVIVLFFGGMGCSGIGGTSNSTTHPAVGPSIYTRAEIIERYNEAGQWRKVPLRTILEGDRAQRVGRIFENPPEKPPGATSAPMRFAISLTRVDGITVDVFIMPDMKKWFNDRHVYDLNPASAKVIVDETKDAKEDSSLLSQMSPVVRVEVVDLEDGYSHRRQVPLKAVATGLVAKATAEAIPEMGLRRPPQGPNGGIPRFRVTFVRENGDRTRLEVIAPGRRDWSWYDADDNQMTWNLSDYAADTLMGILTFGKEDPTEPR